MTTDKESPEERLISAARKAMKNTYSPYSNFPVGAAVLLEDGQIFLGTNIENASYGLTCCAERVALFSARTATDAKVVGIAVSVGQEGDKMHKNALSPCGACRQVMAEFLSPKTPIYLDGKPTLTMEELLPNAFVLVP